MFRKVTGFGIILVLAIIVLGAYVRLSGTQPACTDWPACIDGVFSTTALHAEGLTNAGFDTAKASLELCQRYLLAIMVLVAAIVALMSFWQKNYRIVVITSAFAATLLLVLQGLMGYLIVKFHGMPILALCDTVLPMLVAWLLAGLFLRGAADKPVRQRQGGIFAWVLVAQAVLFLQIVLGVWLSVNNGSTVCSGFPQCNGQWLPPADYASALNFLNGLMTGYTGTLSFDALIAVSLLHRVAALATFIVLSVLLFKTTTANASKPLKNSGLVLGLLLFLQMLVAIVAAKWAMPEWLAVLHHSLAVLLMLPLIAISFYSRYGVAISDQPVAEIQVVVPDSQETLQPVAPVAITDYLQPAPESLYLRLKSQLQRTRTGLGGVLSSLPLGQKDINRDLLEEIEASLIMADIGINVATDIIQQLTQRMERNQLSDAALLSAALKEELLAILKPCSQPLVIPEKDGPFVILVVGVNGAGKTTTIGKLAKRLQMQGHTVMLAAGDTFRAAAVEQLQTWGERNNIPVVAQHTGADSASVIYDAVQSAQAKKIDVLIADTAGRLHTKSNLMDELTKVSRIMGKLDGTAPHEVLLVLDAGTGQNALSQAKIFNEAVSLTGLVLTKLDGTAKGGVIFALAKQLGLPIRYIGIGEGIDDLQDFDAELFVEALCVQD